mgnify:FL=1
MLRQQRMHNMEIDFLAFRAPGAAHILGLILVRNGQIQTDQDGFVFPYLAVNDIVLIGAFLEISRGSYLFTESEFIFL